MRTPLNNSAAVLCICTLLAACNTAPKAPYVPPDTEAGKLRSIAYLPLYGIPVDPPTQTKLSGQWSESWNDVYPGTTWIPSSESTSRLINAKATSEWSAGEALFLRSGQFEPELLQRLCVALQAEGVLQGVLFSAKGGETGSLLRFLTPFAGQPTASSANMSMNLFSCKTLKSSWQGAATIDWSGYTQAQMIEYVHGAVASKIAPTK